MERRPSALRKVAEGKTKIIWSEETVLIENKDDITAGDGARRHVIEGKAELVTTMVANCFRLLDRNGIATHFIERCAPTVIRARRCHMIPVEAVARRLATGSYLKRNPEAAEGSRFDDIAIELYLKDDARHDPLMRFDSAGDEWFVYDAKTPLTAGPIDRFPPERFRFGGRNVDGRVAAVMASVTKRAFLVLEKAWTGQNVTLVDMKIEFGFDAVTGELLVADEVGGDHWRIWPDGDKSQMRDKQVYRDFTTVTPEGLQAVRDNYVWMAEATAKFSP